MDYQNLMEELKETSEALKQSNEKTKMLEEDIDSLQKQIVSLQEQVSYANHQFNTASHQLDLIQHSVFWRTTLPLRSALQKVKGKARSVRSLRLAYNGARILKNQGVKGIFHRSRDKAILKKYHYSPAKYASFLSEEDFLIQLRDPNPPKIKISILVPLYNTPKGFLKEMLDSVCYQTYPNWELCLADGSDSNHAYVEKICRQRASKDSRIRYQKLSENKGISENTNQCAEMATGEYIALLDHDDVLMPSALYEVAATLEQNSDIDVVYTDENRLKNHQFYAPFHKPDWSLDLLYSQMYIGHLLVFRKGLLSDQKLFNAQYNGAQDYDLMLRLSEKAEVIHHIPKCLYAWREHEESTSVNADSKPYAHEAGLNALNDHLKRKYGDKAYAESGKYLFTFIPRFRLLNENPKISIIMPMKDHADLSKRCVDSILEKSTYSNYEILILDNRSQEQETFEWFKSAEAKDSRVKVCTADFEFNWSKLNNFGMEQADGDIYIFLNNDMEVISEDWMERLAENALRDDVGVVGALLLYPDDTIQHAGVVVGMNYWADHVFKGLPPVHTMGPFISPMLTRNVSAVTGACMAVSKKAVEAIGLFDTEFIICGSDIEYCIRANNKGLSVIYNPNVMLYHHESKSRSSYIPEIDFTLSNKVYQRYRESYDPYFNPSLDINSIIPSVGGNVPVHTENCISEASLVYEASPFTPRKDSLLGEDLRINLLVPSIKDEHIFGGISTALKIFENICENLNVKRRIIITDIDADKKDAAKFSDFVMVPHQKESNAFAQIVNYSCRPGKSLPVGKRDVFMATAWWTAYPTQDVIQWQEKNWGEKNKLIYLIQDFEPFFYPWSSHFSMAESTYKMDIPVIAIFNSYLLMEYFKLNQYQFYKELYFDPTMNAKLLASLTDAPSYKRKKQIIFYGRPSAPRNAFEMVIKALKLWSEQQSNIKDWTIYSVGEKHETVDLGNGIKIVSLGKLSLNGYIDLMKETYAAVSLMVSPHPSYPPLEMSSYGIKTITNCYANKDLTGFNDNIISLKDYSPAKIAEALLKVCDKYQEDCPISVNPEYCSQKDIFSDIALEIKKEF